MKTITTVQRIEKTFNIKFDMSEKIPSASVGNAVIELYKNGEDRLAFVLVRRTNDHSDSMTDYHAGTYQKTIKGAIEAVNWINKTAA